jgi:hypothetical protein
VRRLQQFPPACSGKSPSMSSDEQDEGRGLVGLTASILLVAVGAIFRYGVTATVGGVSIQTIGVILMVVGVIGLVLSFVFWSSWGWGAGRAAAERDEEVVLDDSRRDSYQDDDIDRAA